MVKTIHNACRSQSSGPGGSIDGIRLEVRGSGLGPCVRFLYADRPGRLPMGPGSEQSTGGKACGSVGRHSYFNRRSAERGNPAGCRDVVSQAKLGQLWSLFGFQPNPGNLNASRIPNYRPPVSCEFWGIPYQGQKISSAISRNVVQLGCPLNLFRKMLGGDHRENYGESVAR